MLLHWRKDSFDFSFVKLYSVVILQLRLVLEKQCLEEEIAVTLDTSYASLLQYLNSYRRLSNANCNIYTSVVA